MTSENIESKEEEYIKFVLPSFLEGLKDILLDNTKSSINKVFLMHLQLSHALCDKPDEMVLFKIKEIFDSFKESQEEVCDEIQNDKLILSSIYVSKETAEKLLKKKKLK